MRKERKERESEEKNDMDIELETHRDYFGRNYTATLSAIIVLMATWVALFWQAYITHWQLIIGLLFLFIGLLYSNRHYREIYDWLLYLHAEKQLKYIKDVSEQFSYTKFIKRIPQGIKSRFMR